MSRSDAALERAILDYLTEARESIYNPTNLPASVRVLVRDLAQPEARIRQICERLAEHGRIEKFDAVSTYYRLPRAEVATNAPG